MHFIVGQLPNVEDVSKWEYTYNSSMSASVKRIRFSEDAASPILNTITAFTLVLSFFFFFISCKSFEFTVLGKRLIHMLPLRQSLHIASQPVRVSY